MTIEPRTITREYYDVVVTRDLASNADYAADRLLLKFGKLRTPEPGDTVLDVGSSIGVVTDALRRRGLKPVGIEIVPEFVEFARQRFPEIEFLEGAAEDLPFADASFDYVNLSSLIEHVEDWRLTLSESVRVLKPGGVLYISTSNRLWPLQAEIKYFPGFPWLPGFLQRRIYTLAMRRWPDLVGHTHLPAYHWFTWWRLAGELRRLGTEPYSFLQLLSEEDIPVHRRHQTRLIMAVVRSPVPVFPFLPGANLILARKTGEPS
jgi:ubiquinone/menaquinone biosynthesis C-methylase UbiE